MSHRAAVPNADAEEDDAGDNATDADATGAHASELAVAATEDLPTGGNAGFTLSRRSDGAAAGALGGGEQDAGMATLLKAGAGAVTGTSTAMPSSLDTVHKPPHMLWSFFKVRDKPYACGRSWCMYFLGSTHARSYH